MAGAVAEPSLGGVGIGWRPEIAPLIAELPGLSWVEVIAESITDHLPIEVALLADRGVDVVPHGVRLSLGSADGLDSVRVADLAHAAQVARAPLVSEHIAFVRAGGVEAGHLLPMPRTREAVDVVAANARVMAHELACPLALEPIASYVDWPDDELTEGQFLTEILERSDCLLLLDVANVYANAINRGQNPSSLFDEIPLERVAYVHLAGGAHDHDGIYHDTHLDELPQPVIDLLIELRRRTPVPAAMLERDGHYPPDAVLRRELDQIADAARLPRITTASTGVGRGGGRG